MIFGSIQRRHGRRRLVPAVRLVRPGEPRRLGLFQRHQPGGLPRHRAREPDHRRHRDPQRHAVLDRQEGLRLAVSRHPLRLQLRRARRATARPGRRRAMIDDVVADAVDVASRGCSRSTAPRSLPVACMVGRGSTTTSTSVNVREQACTVHVGEFNEFWWFFPQIGQPYNTTVHHLQLQGGMVVAGADERARRASRRPTPRTPSWPTGSSLSSMRLGRPPIHANVRVCRGPRRSTSTSPSGARLTTVKQMMPDIEGDVTNLVYSSTTIATCAIRCSTATPQPGGPVRAADRRRVPVRSDGYVDFRTTGRDIRLRIDVDGPGHQPVHRRPAFDRRRAAGRPLMAQQPTPPRSSRRPTCPTCRMSATR